MILELARELIRRRSVTPDDAGCQKLIAEALEPDGFQATHLRFGQVDNLWLTHGSGAPVVTLVGHTDVVPTGPLEEWSSNPFSPVVRDGHLHGRGAADMKGSVAAMVAALSNFARAHPDHPGTLSLLLTSDEEGEALDGTRRVMEYLAERGLRIDYCLVGEPSSHEQVGDAIKNGRRGSLTGTLTVLGAQGHVAYPHLADNPIHRLAPALAELCATEWDRGNEHYPPTSFQVSNIHAGTGADNVIPGSVELLINFRFSTCLSDVAIAARVKQVLDRHGLRYHLAWRPVSPPFLTPPGRLLDAVVASVRKITGLDPEISTAGGTSDGRFIAPTGTQVVELGPVNRTIHKVDECVRISDLEVLSEIYQDVLRRIFGVDD